MDILFSPAATIARVVLGVLMIAVLLWQGACATPGPESGVTPEQWRERQMSLRFTAANLLITDLQLHGRIDVEKAADLRADLRRGRACLEKRPECGLFGEDDPLAGLEVVKRAASGDPLAQMKLAERLIERLDARLQAEQTRQ